MSELYKIPVRVLTDWQAEYWKSNHTPKDPDLRTRFNDIAYSIKKQTNVPNRENQAS
jgi:hypothetical protein